MPNGGGYRKPQVDIYTVLLLLSFLAIILATVLLYLETKDYGSPPYEGGPSVSMPAEWPANLAFDPFRIGDGVRIRGEDVLTV
jgi:hypothetical protein